MSTEIMKILPNQVMLRQYRRKNNPSNSHGMKIQLKECEAKICHRLTHISKIL